ncbi:MAG TPA: ShlB/FhaC/HecB family hemolysin secretion/activation protein, partial [Prosthecobacter sp.]
PLINNEQISGGGLGNVRGYLESAALGDNGVFGTLELRSPSLLKMDEEGGTEWRFYAFADAGRLTLNDPLPEQESRYDFASVGVGSRFRVLKHLNGSLDAGIPLIRQSVTDVGKVLLTVRFWSDF